MNTGAIDDLAGLADLAAAEGLWFHVDAAFGATALLGNRVRPRLTAIGRADSVAFDFHKWFQVNYEAACVLVRDGESHRRSFTDRPAYLRGGR